MNKNCKVALFGALGLLVIFSACILVQQNIIRSLDNQVKWEQKQHAFRDAKMKMIVSDEQDRWKAEYENAPESEKNKIRAKHLKIIQGRQEKMDALITKLSKEK